MAIMIKKPEGTAGSAAPAILVGLFVAFGGILFGYDTGTIGVKSSNAPSSRRSCRVLMRHYRHSGYAGLDQPIRYIHQSYGRKGP